MNLLWISLLLLLVVECWGRSEDVLFDYKLHPDDLKPSDIALIQFDTRPLSGYWNASAVWNKAYALYHGHKYAYLTINEQCSKDGYKLHSGRVTNLFFFYF